MQIIGELLNPTYRPQTLQLFQQRNAEQCAELIREQQGNGATMLCLGIPSVKDLHRDCPVAFGNWLISLYLEHARIPAYVHVESVHLLQNLLPGFSLPPVVQCKYPRAAERRQLLSFAAEKGLRVVLCNASTADRNADSVVNRMSTLVAEATKAGLPASSLIVEAPVYQSLYTPLLFQEAMATIQLLQDRIGLPVLVHVSQAAKYRLLHSWNAAFYAAAAISYGAEYVLLNPAQREVMGIVLAAREMLEGVGE